MAHETLSSHLPNTFSAQIPADGGKFRKLLKKYLKDDTRRALNGPLLEQLRDTHRSPGGYLNWNHHIARMALCTHVMDMQMDRLDLELLQQDKVASRATLTVLAALGLLAPPRYLHFNLFEVLMQTEPPECIDPPPISLLFYHLFIPKGSIRTETNSSLSSITVFDCESWNEAIKHLPVGPRLEIRGYAKPGVGICAFTDIGEIYFGARPWKPEPGQHVNLTADFFNADPTGIRAVNNKLLGLAVNTYLLMASNPELITTPPEPRINSGRGFSSTGESQRRSAPPTWIGLNYIRTAPSAAHAKRSAGGGPPRATHWRRGHWRRVCYGTQRKERRIQWIKPVLVNA